VEKHEETQEKHVKREKTKKKTNTKSTETMKY